MVQRIAAVRNAGFTLIELMIVVTVLSVLTLSVGLGVTRPRSPNAQDWARFQAAHAQLRDQAILSGEVLGLALDGGGFQRLAWRDGGWVQAGQALRWRDAVQVIAPQDGRGPVLVTPGGRGTALRLRFERGARVTICVTDGWGPVSCEAA